MNIISVSFKSAPIDIRAKFAFTKEEQETFYSQIKNNLTFISQCVIISTCNRCEIYFDGEKSAIRQMELFICSFKGLDIEKALKYFNIYTYQTAVSHLLKVACGIDSMVLGEDEILRQVKEGYYTALKSNITSFEFNTIFKMAITAAKEIKTLTGLSKTPVSIGTLTANEVFNFPKDNKNVLIIGITGKIGSITAKNIASHSDIKITGTSRSHNAESFFPSYPQIEIKDFSSRYELINNADIIISATSSPHYIITKEELKKSLKVKKQRLFIDLAVPNDIDTEVSQMELCSLYDIDYFKKLSENNNNIKLKEARFAEEYIEKWTDEILKELSFRQIIPLLPQINKLIEERSINHLIYSLRKLADREETECVLNWLEKYVDERGK